MSYSMQTQTNPGIIEIWTEGKTDWKILKKALDKLSIALNISFHEYEDEMGDRHLLQKCKVFAEKANQTPMVFIFDRDNRQITAEVNSLTGSYRSWGNNVYSFAIPIPMHRNGYENFSIEMYFTDEEIQTKDAHGRRMFLTSEFNERSGKYRADPKVSIAHKGQLQGYTDPLKAKIIDADVYDEKDNNIALSKASFANNLLNDVPPFDKFNFGQFASVFNILAQIAKETQPTINLYFPPIEDLFNRIRDLPIPQQFGRIFGMINKSVIVALQILIITTIRYYEDKIVSEPNEYRKKARQIKKILSEDLIRPSFATWVSLAEQCYYLVDSNAPQELHSMKSCLEVVRTLGSIGDYIDNLEAIFPPKTGTSILFDKTNRSRDLLHYVLPEMAKYTGRPEEAFTEAFQASNLTDLSIETWQNAWTSLNTAFEPMFGNTMVLRSLERVNTITGEYIVSVKKYTQGNFECSEVSVSIEEADQYQSNFTEMLISGQRSIHLFPFLLIKDDTLFFYNRTLASGYEYCSIAEDRVYRKETKKKFNHSVFKTGSKQELFWTEVIPTTNDINGITANLPDEGLLDFVGREKQINLIKEEIIEIPNQNGIVYGPGGIGKTALMIQLSKKLFEDSGKEDVLFHNIVWVSAKSDYYDYIFDSIERRQAQVKSLDNILLALLRFFGFENLEEYTIEDKKELTLELLKDNEILLILDNLETIPAPEVEKIIRFFDIEVKRSLRRKPGQFKVIITSRKQIPCGFHQVELKGLDLEESKALMAKLYERHRITKDMLSDQQQERIHEAAKGIPIVIKHCFARLYEYNEPIETVVSNLSHYSSEIIQFSFREILQQIEKKDKNGVQLKTLVLLELINYPLMVRQISDILEVDEGVIASKLPTLIDYQCLKRINQKDQEKYMINAEIRLLTRSLVQEHDGLSQEIRKKIINNFSVDKKLDYTSDELQIVSIFEKYLSDEEYLEAEDFINAQLKEHSKSVLIRYHYARYLKERKNQAGEAIKILEELRESSSNHPSILKLLFLCYISLDIPNFEKANVYVNELEKQPEEDESLKSPIGEFYVKWSTSIKLNKGIDPLEEGIRQSTYKRLANKAITVLNSIHNKTHEVYYLLAQSYFNLWDYETADRMIERAILLITASSAQGSLFHYKNLKRLIREKEHFYSRFDQGTP